MSWFIIGYKTFGMGGTTPSRSFIQQFRNATSLLSFEIEMFDASPARAMFRAGYMELNLLLKEREGGEIRPAGDGPAAPATSIQAFENIERALQRAQRNAISQLEYALTFLATVGSAALYRPFRYGLGDHERVCRHRHIEANSRDCHTSYRRGTGCYCYRFARRYPCRDGI